MTHTNVSPASSVTDTVEHLRIRRPSLVSSEFFAAVARVFYLPPCGPVLHSPLPAFSVFLTSSQLSASFESEDRYRPNPRNRVHLSPLICPPSTSLCPRTSSSRIFSSGRFQEEEIANARESELSFARATSSHGSLHGSLGSSGSSSEVLARAGSSRWGVGASKACGRRFSAGVLWGMAVISVHTWCTAADELPVPTCSTN